MSMTVSISAAQPNEIFFMILYGLLFTQVSEVGNALPQSPEGAFRTQAGVKPLQNAVETQGFHPCL